MSETADAAFSARHKVFAEALETVLDRLLTFEAQAGEIARPARLIEAMRYAVLGGGKRLRPFLLAETARIFGKAPDEGVLRAGAALELVHCYSLAHDDLPAMDDDDFRRGKPSLHRAFDEATAILAGDALLTLAFEILADAETDADPAVRAALVLGLARAAGPGGMVGGQVYDITGETPSRAGKAPPPAPPHKGEGESDKTPPPAPPHKGEGGSDKAPPPSPPHKGEGENGSGAGGADLPPPSWGRAGEGESGSAGEGESSDGRTRMISMKTAALFRFAAEAGAVIGRAEPKARALLADFGEHLGVAFQLADDIADKDVNADREGLARHAGEALARLDAAGHSAESLRSLVGMVVKSAG